MNEVSSSKHKEETEVISNVKKTERPDRLFEYTGNHSLTIKGVVSGKIYHFKFNGDKIKVDYNDSFALMAERDLKVLSSSLGRNWW